MLVPKYRSHIISHSVTWSYHLNFTVKIVESLCLSIKIVINASSCPNRSKTRLETNLRFFKEKLIDTMAVYTLSVRKNKCQISADRCYVSADNHEDGEKWNISIFELWRLTGRKGKAQTDLGGSI